MRIGILCDGENGAVNIASVANRTLLVAVALEAINEAEARAVVEMDHWIRVVRRLELERLRATLLRLIPELRKTVRVQ